MTAAEALRALYRVPAWVRGGLSTEDAEFLVEQIGLRAPWRVVELGVAAGTSAAAILFALDQLPQDDPQARAIAESVHYHHPREGSIEAIYQRVRRARGLFSADLSAVCYFDRARPIGGAVAEMYPTHRAGWILKPNTTAQVIGRACPPELFDLAVIDADHRHPWPLLDLLHLWPALGPEAWIVLHDIDLARLYPEFPSHGAEWLFEAWPFPKIRASDSTNIGAVQLPPEPQALDAVVAALVERPWEAHPTVWDVDLRLPAFEAVLARLAPHLANPDIRRPGGRPRRR